MVFQALGSALSMRVYKLGGAQAGNKTSFSSDINLLAHLKYQFCIVPEFFMLFSKVLQLLATAGTALARTVPAKTNNHLAIRQDSGDIEALERAANSRLPDVPLPASINDATTIILQLMAIWYESELAGYEDTISLVTNNSHGYTDLRRWNKSEVLGILKTNLAVLKIPSTTLG